MTNLKRFAGLFVFCALCVSTCNRYDDLRTQDLRAGSARIA